jgi:hypothetical protein
MSVARSLQRIVVRPHAQHHAQRRAPDLPYGALGNHKARAAIVEVLQRFDGGLDVFDGAIELLARISEALADLPHDQLDDEFALLRHLPHELLHARNAIGDRHRGPRAASVGIGGHGRVKRCVAFGFAHHRVAADLDLLHAARARVAGADWREDCLAGAVPFDKFAANQRVPLMHRFGQAVFGWNICGRWKVRKLRVAVGGCHGRLGWLLVAKVKPVLAIRSIDPPH